jgi:hypothetical protein
VVDEREHLQAFGGKCGLQPLHGFLDGIAARDSNQTFFVSHDFSSPYHYHFTSHRKRVPQLMGGAVQSIPSQVEKNAEEPKRPKLEAAAVTHFSPKKREQMGPPDQT